MEDKGGKSTAWEVEFKQMVRLQCGGNEVFVNVRRDFVKP